MTKTQFRFKNTTLKNRSKKGKPVWLWKWTTEARHVYKQAKKEGKL